MKVFKFADITINATYTIINSFHDRTHVPRDLYSQFR